MSALNEQLTRREFLTTAAAFTGLPLIAGAGEAAAPRRSGFPITATARFTSACPASRKASR